ncbi:MAG: hypothetical protein A3B99_02770 [Candidatus Yanofskybacteria bacterium RIFCSPHIGHO2_02_FULL_44_12b]|uniref:DUF4134 domain-containing protein n=2 Tax=Candidatus Yanofskyibacteriota TaxID=1752733 RepID=A0A1F8GLW8_9BACT|nr:MAG: hypothetical protein UW79_C0017G0006 [Candidatus Yanofskybacteria bacterium GW2011_GWA2_44_9]OGN05028.1 MAG: hypothetical protein A2659_02645 [Candidatus Yanofskybacteria bacterium RIFCSPHIGHO2_01_FULL_44_24]OGN16213.1 MAG: hypothetical protein A3B99_02770 [Candidatus Yanofskybacteria bacterium RIFCSPHIGHO2_02_FULL_44_12b]OGN26343.1 MAG: hypothetical protein A2925_00420 [Candidatus Yanofskybacteria bacterium RIFCSPLOWO2_01_FULL_44_22]
MKKFNKIAQISVASAAILMPFLAFAQLAVPTNPVAATQGLTLSEIEQRITDIAQFLIVISVVVAVIFIIWGGIKYVMAGDDAAKAGSAKTTILNGVIGALVILAVGIIMQTLANVVARTFFT